MEGPVIQGSYFDIVVTAIDINGNIAVGYVGTVQTTKDTTDDDDLVPTDFEFEASDRGTARIKLRFGVQGALTFWDPLDQIASFSTGTIYFFI